MEKRGRMRPRTPSNHSPADSTGGSLRRSSSAGGSAGPSRTGSDHGIEQEIYSLNLLCAFSSNTYRLVFVCDISRRSFCEMQELALGDEGFGAPERAHRLVYHVRENRWERMETQVPLNT